MESAPSTPGSEVFRATNEAASTAGNASPPNSQEAQMTDAVNGNADSFTQAQENASSIPVDLTREGGEQADNAKDREPGWGWTNKQAQEEINRAYDLAVDKDFSEKLREFGDVLDES